MILVLLFIATLEAASLSNTVKPSENFPYVSQLDSRYKVYWKFNSTHITFETHVKTLGYVGFGISLFPYKAEKPHDLADMVIGWVDDVSQKVYFKDRISRGHGLPQVDAKQDWKLLYSQQTEDTTILKFVRKLDTCDKDDIVIKDGTTRVIWSYNDADPIFETTIGYHGNSRRGVKSIYLLQPPTTMYNSEPIQDPHSFYVDFMNYQYNIRSLDTTYKCKAFKNPLPSHKKYHVTSFEAVIQKENLENLHHIILYQCNAPVDAKWDGHEYVCYDEQPNELWSCFGVYIAWAVGGTSYHLPDHVGLPIGGNDGPQFFVLETHYNNPELKADIVDSSGIRLTVTENLRQFDGGVIETGVNVNPRQIIPPKSVNFQSKGYCPKECLSQALKKVGGEIKVVANVLHLHLVGVEMRTTIVRNGTEVAVMDGDYNYDFLYQSYKNTRGEITIKDGDSLITDCYYSTKNKTTFTYGGLSTHHEMCLSLAIYYPRQNSLTNCLSVPHYGKYDNIWNKLDWTKESSHKLFQKIVDEVDQRAICQGDGTIKNVKPLYSSKELQPENVLLPQEDCWKSLP